MKNKRSFMFVSFWATQSLSQLGSEMTSFALIIWAYKQTQSAMTVSLLSFYCYLPYILASILAGAFIDSHKKKNILLFTDSAAAACTLFVAAVSLTGHLLIGHIYAVNAVIGIANAFQSPTSAVATGQMVPKDKLAKVSGMNSFSSSLTAVAAPMLAASLISFGGIASVLIADFVTFLTAFITLLVFIRIPEAPLTEKQPQNFVSGCKEGFAFLYSRKELLYLILSMAVMNFFSRLTYENILSVPAFWEAYPVCCGAIISTFKN